MRSKFELTSRPYSPGGSMPISVTCACGTKLTAPDAASGKAATCPKCKARLKLPSMVATNNPPVGATTPVPPSAPGPVAKRQGFPLWILAVGILTVGTLFLSCIGGVGFVAYRWGSGTKPAAPLQDTAEAKAQIKARMKRDRINRESPPRAS